MNEVLQLFEPEIREWFLSRFPSPSRIQEAVWPEAAKGSHILATAPTGCGKTLAAFLWSINSFLNGSLDSQELSVLYISPLKALNNDIATNLRKPLEELETLYRSHGKEFPPIEVAVRSGDTSQEERRKQKRRAPSILITTPESLHILLTSNGGRNWLASVKTLILDEIHAVAESKRGSLLMSAVERLTLYAGEVQRIMLSATVRPADRIARFGAGYTCNSGIYTERPVKIIKTEDKKQYKLTIVTPPKEEKEFWDNVGKKCLELMETYSTVLFFCISRRMTERLASLINGMCGETLVYPHHGALSRELRYEVETRMKEGRIRGIAATSSLELGIDIGDLEAVVLIQSPATLASGIQMIGRSGHQVGAAANGLFFPLFGYDYLESVCARNSIPQQELEEIHPIKTPLDILAQVILSHCCFNKTKVDKLFDFIRQQWAFHELSRENFDRTLEMLAGRYSSGRVRELRPRIIYDRTENTILSRDHVPFLIYSSGGAIPDRGYYNLKVYGSGERIGELDEEFVWERKSGESFPLGNQLWKIVNITHNDVEVIPSDGAMSIVPFWRAEDRFKSFFYAEKTALLLEELETKVFIPRIDEESRIRKTGEICRTETSVSADIYHFLAYQKEQTKAALPHRHHLLVEYYEDPFQKRDSQQILLHTLWGGKVNHPFSLFIAGVWKRKYNYNLPVYGGDSGILIHLPHEFKFADLLKLINPENLEESLKEVLESSPLFGALFRENAGRALLLPKGSIHKRMPFWLNRIRGRKLFDQIREFEDFPLVIETWRHCIEDMWDLESLKGLILELQSGEITYSESFTRTPSPFSSDLIWQQTNIDMYADDTERSSTPSSLSGEILKELLAGSRLQSIITKESISLLEEKLHRTAPGYSPESPEDLKDWVEERIFIPESEWISLQKAILRDYSEEVFNGNENWLHRRSPGMISLVESVKEKPDLNSQFPFFELMRFYGPRPLSFWESFSGIPAKQIENLLSEELEANRLVYGKLSDSGMDEICDTENWERLILLERKKRRPDFTARKLSDLPFFLASYQELLYKGEDIDSLKIRLEELFCYPERAELWETAFLPARIDPYYPEWLDSLFYNSPLEWNGAGNKKLLFNFPEDKNLLGKKASSEWIEPNQSKELFEISRSKGISSGEMTEHLWKDLWKGKLRLDSFQALRNSIENGFNTTNSAKGTMAGGGKSRFARWEKSRPVRGMWHSNAFTPDEDPLSVEGRSRDKIRQLFLRYGILFREILVKETRGWQWKDIFRELRRMEMAGEIIGGFFFEGIPGAQFMTPDAFRHLKNTDFSDDTVYWINACDPISFSGKGITGLQQELPSRLPGNWMVYSGSQLLMIITRNGKSVEIRISPDDPLLPEAFSVFNNWISRVFKPVNKVVVEEINQKTAVSSEFYNVFRKKGFDRSGDKLILRRSWNSRI